MKRTRTVSESTTFVVAVQPQLIRTGWCSECSAIVSWLSLPFAKEVLKASCEVAIHIDGGLVCSQSMLRAMEESYE